MRIVFVPQSYETVCDHPRPPMSASVIAVSYLLRPDFCSKPHPFARSPSEFEATLADDLSSSVQQPREHMASTAQHRQALAACQAHGNFRHDSPFLFFVLT